MSPLVAGRGKSALPTAAEDSDAVTTKWLERRREFVVVPFGSKGVLGDGALGEEIGGNEGSLIDSPGLRTEKPDAPGALLVKVVTLAREVVRLSPIFDVIGW